MKDKFFLLLGVTFIIGCFYIFLQQPVPEKYIIATDNRQPTTYNIIRIGEHEIEVEIANTEQARELGLSRRESMGSNFGMLFVFDELGFHGIWMKDMNFSIDIVWLDVNMKVTDIKRLVNPDTYPQVFYPTEEAKFVLELVGGESERLNIDTGSSLNLIGKY